MNVVLVLETTLAFQLRIVERAEYLSGESILASVSSSHAASRTIDCIDDWT
jgi:hypothetical protein